ncbi:DUF1129 family protein [Bombilactobacillus thymidiniphilus]|uniref:DUF1129 domain-containing protein n=1 Tax=Bombilactobacillus thymidiniphilus TaxID=2923363 RepID=A0ABY4PBP9_9LACO|nr:DUF1129 family protein [Bombilactobacillus thymidiniphilus]UQS83025.1 DUF1129 domain-containing protein [Bombilactobacillus thymidiniphilus]
MDSREKNAKAQVNQQERHEKKQQQEVVQEQIQSTDVDNLRTKLSNKNADYLFKLRRQLLQKGQTEEKAQELTDSLLVEVINNQIKGIPARQLYGTVEQQAQVLVQPPKKSQNVADEKLWKLAVDNSLLFASLFLVMYGFIGLFSKQAKNTTQSGLSTIILISILWGVLFSWFNQKMAAAKQKREPIWKVALTLVLGMVIMYLVVALTMILPPFLNPVFSPTVYVILAILAFGGRWLFRNYYDIHYNTFSGR